jgi:hypothetical protein
VGNRGGDSAGRFCHHALHPYRQNYRLQEAALELGRERDATEADRLERFKPLAQRVERELAERQQRARAAREIEQEHRERDQQERQRQSRGRHAEPRDGALGAMRIDILRDNVYPRASRR